MPRLMTKLGNTEMRRSAMKNYREPLERHFDHCFYCCIVVATMIRSPGRKNCKFL